MTCNSFKLIIFSALLILFGCKTINGKLGQNEIVCDSKFKTMNGQIKNVSFKFTELKVWPEKWNIDNHSNDNISISIFGGLKSATDDEFDLSPENFVIESEDKSIYELYKILKFRCKVPHPVSSMYQGIHMVYLLDKKIFKNKLYFSVRDVENKNIMARILIFDPNGSTWNFTDFGKSFLGIYFDDPKWTSGKEGNF